ncbi:hypothetical protein V2J09_018160 [Rumex salicifolius]
MSQKILRALRRLNRSNGSTFSRRITEDIYMGLGSSILKAMMTLFMCLTPIFCPLKKHGGMSSLGTLLASFRGKRP